MIVFLWKISRQFYRLRLNLGWIGKTEARTREKKRVFNTNQRRSVPFVWPHCPRETMFQLGHSSSGETCVEENSVLHQLLSPFDIAGELLMRRCHIFFPDLHRFHKHPAQRFQVFYRHLKNVSPVFPALCLSHSKYKFAEFLSVSLSIYIPRQACSSHHIILIVYLSTQPK